jgi:hypothetical protein
MNFFDIGTIVWPERYTSSEQIDKVDLRVLETGKVYCYKILNFLQENVRFEYTSSSPSKEFLPSVVRKSILAKQCGALIEYAGGRGNNNVTIKQDILRENILQDFSSDPLWVVSFLELKRTKKLTTFSPFLLDASGEIIGAKMKISKPKDPPIPLVHEEKLGVHLH